jgi:type II secretory pathway predicted ATPase ExeA
MTETLDFGMSETDADMLASMPEVRRNRAQFMDRLYGKYLRTGVDKAVKNSIGRLAEEAAAAKDGNRTEGRALFVIGETGAGKTRVVNEALDNLPELQATRTEMWTISPVARVVAPSPMTLLQLGQEILHAIGYPMQRKVQESAIWREVRNQLKLRGVRVIHIDEGQHMLAWRNPQEMEKLANTLKNTMQRRDWPVWFVVSGLPELAAFVGQDRQIQRRSDILHLASLDPAKNSKLPEWIVLELVETHAGMTLGVKVGDGEQSLVPAEFLNRLCHAAWYQFGILTDLVRGAIEQALIRDPAAATVEHKDFVKAYKAFSGCPSHQNVMKVANWHEIDPREAIQQVRTARYSKPDGKR